MHTCTLNSTYNKKKYVDILLCYRWLFIKGNVFIGEWGIFGAEVFLRYSLFFIKSNFVIGRVGCISGLYSMSMCMYLTYVPAKIWLPHCK